MKLSMFAKKLYSLFCLLAVFTMVLQTSGSVLAADPYEPNAQYEAPGSAYVAPTFSGINVLDGGIQNDGTGPKNVEIKDDLKVNENFKLFVKTLTQLTIDGINVEGLLKVSDGLYVNYIRPFANGIIYLVSNELRIAGGISNDAVYSDGTGAPVLVNDDLAVTGSLKVTTHINANGIVYNRGLDPDAALRIADDLEVTGTVSTPDSESTPKPVTVDDNLRVINNIDSQGYIVNSKQGNNDPTLPIIEPINPEDFNPENPNPAFSFDDYYNIYGPTYVKDDLAVDGRVAINGNQFINPKLKKYPNNPVDGSNQIYTTSPLDGTEEKYLFLNGVLNVYNHISNKGEATIYSEAEPRFSNGSNHFFNQDEPNLLPNLPVVVDDNLNVKGPTVFEAPVNLDPRAERYIVKIGAEKVDCQEGCAARNGCNFYNSSTGPVDILSGGNITPLSNPINPNECPSSGSECPLSVICCSEVSGADYKICNGTNCFPSDCNPENTAICAPVEVGAQCGFGSDCKTDVLRVMNTITPKCLAEACSFRNMLECNSDCIVNGENVCINKCNVSFPVPSPTPLTITPPNIPESCDYDGYQTCVATKCVTTPGTLNPPIGGGDTGGTTTPSCDCTGTNKCINDNILCKANCTTLTPYCYNDCNTIEQSCLADQGACADGCQDSYNDDTYNPILKIADAAKYSLATIDTSNAGALGDFSTILSGLTGSKTTTTISTTTATTSPTLNTLNNIVLNFTGKSILPSATLTTPLVPLNLICNEPEYSNCTESCDNVYSQYLIDHPSATDQELTEAANIHTGCLTNCKVNNGGISICSTPKCGTAVQASCAKSCEVECGINSGACFDTCMNRDCPPNPSCQECNPTGLQSCTNDCAGNQTCISKCNLQFDTGCEAIQPPEVTDPPTGGECQEPDFSACTDQCYAPASGPCVESQTIRCPTVNECLATCQNTYGGNACDILPTDTPFQIEVDKVTSWLGFDRNEIASVGSKLFLNYDVGDMVVIGGYPMSVVGNLFGRELNLNYGLNPISTLFSAYVISTLDDFGFVDSRDYMKGEDDGGIPTSLWVTSNIYSAGMFSLFDVAMLNASVVDISMFNYSSNLFSKDIAATRSITTPTLLVNNIMPNSNASVINIGANLYSPFDMSVNNFYTQQDISAGNNINVANNVDVQKNVLVGGYLYTWNEIFLCDSTGCSITLRDVLNTMNNNMNLLKNAINNGTQVDSQYTYVFPLVTNTPIAPVEPILP